MLTYYCWLKSFLSLLTIVLQLSELYFQSLLLTILSSKLMVNALINLPDITL